MPALHIFNPEHDWSLAQGRVGGSPPLAAVRLKRDLAFLPAVMASDGDYVLTPDIALTASQLREWTGKVATVHPVHTDDNLSSLPISRIQPWGWDAHLCRNLRERGINTALLPSSEQCERIRQHSHRRTAQRLLQQMTESLDSEAVVGESMLCPSMDAVRQALTRYGDVVLKAPWSSSGRGVMICRGGTLHERDLRRVENVLSQQGGVMCEPLYERVNDFAMEFVVHPDGSIDYLGLSLFTTAATQYSGNLLASEAYKCQYLSRFHSPDLLTKVRDMLLQLLPDMLSSDYHGLLGVDMMTVRTETKKDATLFALHPCVEVNLRCTMGHVALALSKRIPDTVAQMQIVHREHFVVQLSEPTGLQSP